MTSRLTGLKIFRPQVELVLKITGIALLAVLLVVPVAWGYRQQHDAQTWREIACAYRLREALKDGRLVSAADVIGSPCARLAELGLNMERPVLVPAKLLIEARRRSD